MLNLDLKYIISKSGKIKKNKDSNLSEFINLKNLLENKVKYVSIRKNNLNLMGFSYQIIKKKLMILIKLAESNKIYIHQDNNNINFINKKYLIDYLYITMLIIYYFSQNKDNIYFKINNFKNIEKYNKYILIYLILYFNYQNKYLSLTKNYQNKIINKIFYNNFIIDNIKREELIKFKNFNDLYKNIKGGRVYKKFLKIKREIIKNNNLYENFNNLLNKIKDSILYKESLKKENILLYNSISEYTINFKKFTKNNIRSIINDIRDKKLRIYLNSVLTKFSS